MTWAKGMIGIQHVDVKQVLHTLLSSICSSHWSTCRNSFPLGILAKHLEMWYSQVHLRFCAATRHLSCHQSLQSLDSYKCWIVLCCKLKTNNEQSANARCRLFRFRWQVWVLQRILDQWRCLHQNLLCTQQETLHRNWTRQAQYETCTFVIASCAKTTNPINCSTSDTWKQNEAN